jgi:hypothetical protein
MLLALLAAVLFLSIGESERTATIAAGVMLLGFMSCSTILYCVEATKLEVHKPYSVLYRPVSRRLAFLSASVILALTALPGVEAAVVDRRLRKLVSGRLDAQSVKDLTNVLTTAVQRGIDITGPTIASVNGALERSRSENLQAAEQASALTFLASIGWPPGMVGPIYDTNKQFAGRTWGFLPIAANTGPDSYMSIGITENRGDIAIMQHLSDPVPSFDTGPALFIAKGMTATLDGWHLKHIVFQDMALTYSGGPLILEGVCFLGCHFAFGDDAESQLLIAEIQHRGWVNFIET